MQKLRIVLQVNEGDDSRPRWIMLHSSIFTEDSTPEMLADTLESLALRVTKAMGWKDET